LQTKDEFNSARFSKDMDAKIASIKAYSSGSGSGSGTGDGEIVATYNYAVDQFDKAFAMSAGYPSSFTNRKTSDEENATTYGQQSFVNTHKNIQEAKDK